MKLEIKRLHLGLSAAERDRALLSIGVIPATVDPNHSVDYPYLLKLSSLADNLALLGHAVLEDRVNASIGLEQGSEHTIDFWNLSENDEACYDGACEVRAPSSLQASATGENRSVFVECYQCERTVCKACCAGRGAFLLLNTYKDLKIYGGSQGGGYSALTDNFVCKSCCSEIIKHALYVDYVRVLQSLRRKDRAEKAALNAVNQVCQLESSKISDLSQSIQIGQRQLKQILDGEESLAEFPFASFLQMVFLNFVLCYHNLYSCMMCCTLFFVHSAVIAALLWLHMDHEKTVISWPHAYLFFLVLKMAPLPHFFFFYEVCLTFDQALMFYYSG